MVYRTSSGLPPVSLPLPSCPLCRCLVRFSADRLRRTETSPRPRSLSARAAGARNSPPPGPFRKRLSPRRQKPVAPAAQSAEPISVPPDTRPLSVETGLASWYGAPYHNRRGSNGEIYDMNAMTAAHRTLPLGLDCARHQRQDRPRGSGAHHRPRAIHFRPHP